MTSVNADTIVRLRHYTTRELLQPRTKTALKLAYHSGSITRGNKYKVLSHRFHYDARKHYFSARTTVNIWNTVYRTMLSTLILSTYF